MEQPKEIYPKVADAIQLLIEERANAKKDAIEIIESTIANYDTKQYPSYSSGLAGIGCAVQYAIHEQLIDAKADEVLTEIDEELFTSVYFRHHSDLSHRDGLIGLASYFFYRLQDQNASDNNLCTLTSKSVLLSILDIISARFRLNGCSYPLFNNLPESDCREKEDIKLFLNEFIQYDICNTQALNLLKVMNSQHNQNAVPMLNPVCKDLDDVTIVIPIRIDSPERRKNLETILHIYTTQTNVHLIIWEADASQSLYLKPYYNVEYVFQVDNNPTFHFTHYRNEMIKRAETPIVAIWDADVVVPIEQLYMAAEAIRNYGIVLSYPYDGICHNLSPVLSEHFYKELDIMFLETQKNFLPTMFGMSSVGGVCLVNKSAYIKAGAENEYFIGWGAEDVERLKRITILDLPVYRVQGVIFHLWHPHKLNSCFSNIEYNWGVKKEFLRICKMDKCRLLAEIEGWEWVHV